MSIGPGKSLKKKTNRHLHDENIKLRVGVQLSTAGILIIAIAGLIGYYSGFRVLGSFRLNYIPIAPSTAICFIIFSATLLKNSQQPLQGFNLIVLTFLVFLTTLFCILEIAELFVRYDLNFSEILFPAVGKIGNIPIGKMSPFTASIFNISGIGVFALLMRRQSSRYFIKLGNLVSIIGLMTLFIGTTVLLAYLYGIPFMYGGSTIPMAATTALAFIFLGMALTLSSGPESFVMRRTTGNSTSAVLCRIFIPLVITIVIIESIILRYMKSVMINEALVMAFLVAAIGLITGIVVERVANYIGRNIDDINDKLNSVMSDLKDSEEKFRTLFNSSEIAMFRSRLDGSETLDVNKKFLDLVGKTREEILGKPSAILWVDVNEREEMVRRLVTDGSVSEYEYRMLHEQKGIRHCVTSLRLEREQNIIVGSIADITERKQAEAEKQRLEYQLHQSQKMESVGRLAGGVAHDFNNMLSVIIGHTEMILEQISPEHPSHEDLTEIKKAAERSADLTRQLLSFARKQTISPKVLNLNETIDGMLKLIRRLIGEDISLNWLPSENLWTVKADPSQIDQILANLCVNARDAIPGIGWISIETENSIIDEEYCTDHTEVLPGEYVRLNVSDNGCGMDRETLPNIFEPFYTTKGLGEGTGLGLSTIYGAVKQNKGFINVYSELGKGTTFSIYLPRHSKETCRIQTPARPEKDMRGTETILIVEDEPTILKLIVMMLEKQGYTILSVGTPTDAIRISREFQDKIHLLLTDVIMPEMNGRDLFRNITISHPHIKCLFMSGYTANIIEHQGVLGDGVQFIQKPFSKKDLTAKIRMALESEI